MKKSYCTQGGDCATCSLTNYGRDCKNHPIKKKADDNREPHEELTTGAEGLEENIPELEPAVEPAPDDCEYCADFGESHTRHESTRRKCFHFTTARLLPRDGVPLWCPRRGTL